MVKKLTDFVICVSLKKNVVKSGWKDLNFENQPKTLNYENVAP